jgi:hypothetical protein
MAETSGMHADDWQKRRKEDAKRHAETLLKEWTKRMTIDDIVLARDMKSILTIDSKPVNEYNIVYLRSLCIKLRINGYKNKRREEMTRLLLERKRIQIVESIHYYPSDLSTSLPRSTSDDNPVNDGIDPLPTNNAVLLVCSTEEDSSSNSPMRQTRLPPSSSLQQQGILDNTTTPYSSSETRSMSRACLLAAKGTSNEHGVSADATSSQKNKALTRKNASKGSVPQ